MGKGDKGIRGASSLGVGEENGGASIGRGQEGCTETGYGGEERDWWAWEQETHRVHAYMGMGYREPLQ